MCYYKKLFTFSCSWMQCNLIAVIYQYLFKIAILNKKPPRKLWKVKVNSQMWLKFGFSATPLSGYFCCVRTFCTQSKSVQIKIVLNFSILLYYGVNQALQMKYTHVPEIESRFLKKEERQTMVVSISACTTASEVGSCICNKKMLFLWKYQVSLNLAFGIERLRNFCIFVWSAKRRGGRGKTLTVKIR